MAFVRAASLEEVPEGEVVGVEAGGARLCLARVEGEVYAFQDRCSHREFPLSSGELDSEECTITCEWHGARFDIRTGEPQCLPATRPIPVYACRVDGGEIYVDVPA
ncbi:MAG TPA: non-heme iron oxygenase ferredoxin subunit [Longimicrobiaceae bacterium]|nr:non-heme iron oxygenase ferredoxin subunit [Longimicrobiaceae bacterium]